MIWAAWVADTLLYVCFAILVGYLTLLMVPDAYKPNVNIGRPIMAAATFAIPVLSFVGILRIVLFFSSDMGFSLTLNSVLFTFEEGKAFWWVSILSVILGLLFIFIDLEKMPQARTTAWLLVMGMLMVSAWASHVGSLYGMLGFIGNVSHFVAVSLWGGVLLLIGWFARKADNWEAFLRWFTPFAIVCLIIVLLSGLAMMFGVVPEYVNSWVMSYGQAILIKHITIIPLVILAFFNGILYRSKRKITPGWNPIPWVRAESVILFLVLATTGFMQQQTPPHDVSYTIKESGASSWFMFFNAGKLSADLDIQLGWNPISIVFAILACIALGYVWNAFRYKLGAKGAVAGSVLFVVLSYVSLMTSVQ